MGKIIFYIFGFLSMAVNGYFIYKLCVPFISLREHKYSKIIIYLLFSIVSGMVIWVGDNNLIFTFPIFILLFLISTKGELIGRVTVSLIFFCYIMSVCAIIDTYLGEKTMDFILDEHLIKIFRPVIFGIVYLVMKKQIPNKKILLSNKMWKLIFGLTSMSVCSLFSVILLTINKYNSSELYNASMNMGIVILPIVLVSTLILMLSIKILSEHEEIERYNHLLSLKENYYQNVKNQEEKIRQLRHDLRNHLTVLYGLIEQNDREAAKLYIDKLYELNLLKGRTKFCENEMINVVLSAKSEELEKDNIKIDIAAEVAKEIPFQDTDICALIGNALDNAHEALVGEENTCIKFRCRFNKGIFMMKVENPIIKNINQNLTTTKKNKELHGFGIKGMEEIANKNNGTLNIEINNNKFMLTICLVEKKD